MFTKAWTTIANAVMIQKGHLIEAITSAKTYVVKYTKANLLKKMLEKITMTSMKNKRST